MGCFQSTPEKPTPPTVVPEPKVVKVPLEVARQSEEPPEEPLQSTEEPPTTAGQPGPQDLANILRKDGDSARRHGNFSDVWMGTLQLGDKNTTVAIKCLRATGMETEGEGSSFVRRKERLHKRMRRELSAWIPASDHPFVLKCLGYATIEGVPALVSPWCEKGNAWDYLAANEHFDKKRLISQVAAALEHLHSRNPPIVHLDVRLTNVLIADDDRAQLSDFGLATIMAIGRTGNTTSAAVNLQAKYQAPELEKVTDFDAEGLDPRPADVYAFALLMLEAMSNALVYPNVTSVVAISSDKQAGVVPSPKDHPLLLATEPLWPLLRNCWSQDPRLRPTMRGVVNELKLIGYPDVEAEATEA